jgi:hypothetical protein
MSFLNEMAFRQWLVDELSKYLMTPWQILRGKNLADIILCYDDQTRPLILFIEVKYHKVRHGRIGFGNGEGLGYQPEILQKKPAFLERYMRWLIADDISNTCLFFTNGEVRNNCAANIREDKQNNFVYNLFEKNRELLFPIDDAPELISKWASLCQSKSE